MNELDFHFSAYEQKISFQRPCLHFVQTVKLFYPEVYFVKHLSPSVYYQSEALKIFQSLSFYLFKTRKNCIFLSESSSPYLFILLIHDFLLRKPFYPGAKLQVGVDRLCLGFHTQLAPTFLCPRVQPDTHRSWTLAWRTTCLVSGLGSPSPSPRIQLSQHLFSLFWLRTRHLCDPPSSPANCPLLYRLPRVMSLLSVVSSVRIHCPARVLGA